jgi:hypothetical protein
LSDARVTKYTTSAEWPLITIIILCIFCFFMLAPSSSCCQQDEEKKSDLKKNEFAGWS